MLLFTAFLIFRFLHSLEASKVPVSVQLEPSTAPNHVNGTFLAPSQKRPTPLALPETSRDIRPSQLKWLTTSASQSPQRLRPSLPQLRQFTTVQIACFLPSPLLSSAQRRAAKNASIRGPWPAQDNCLHRLAMEKKKNLCKTSHLPRKPIPPNSRSNMVKHHSISVIFHLLSYRLSPADVFFRSSFFYQ